MDMPRHNVRENFLLALDTLRTHKFRAFLTILGVLIGTATVIGVASIFKGLDQQMVDMAQGFGTRTLFIYKFDPGIKFNLTREERMRKPLTYEQAMAIKEYCPSVESVSVEIFNWGPPVSVAPWASSSLSWSARSWMLSSPLRCRSAPSS